MDVIKWLTLSTSVLPQIVGIASFDTNIRRRWVPYLDLLQSTEAMLAIVQYAEPDDIGFGAFSRYLDMSGMRIRFWSVNLCTSYTTEERRALLHCADMARELCARVPIDVFIKLNEAIQVSIESMADMDRRTLVCQQTGC